MSLTEADLILPLVFKIIILKKKILKELMDINFLKKQGN
jgi:hypothetical protein